MNTLKSKLLACAAFTVFSVSIVNAALTPDDIKLDSYKQTSGVSGNLNSTGSDTLNNLMTLWSESFRAIYPNVVISVDGKGSSTAPPALIEGISQLGPMSRDMKSSEIDAFEQKYGYKPTAVPVAIDALAVFVHKDNPIKGLSLKEVDAIFSNTYRMGGAPVNNWGQLEGMDADSYKNRAISLYGRNSASGTYGFFKDVALQGGDFRNTVKEQPGSSAVVQGIGTDLYAIGYSGIGYMTSGVKALPLSLEGDEYFEPTYENCLTLDYPLARFLYVYVNKKPNEPLDKLTAEFLSFVMSKEGQEVVLKDGYYPLPAEIVEETKSLLDLQ